METQKKRVLLVEDSREMQAIVRHAVEGICSLYSVSSADEGRKELEKGIYSLLLLDVSLPDANGFEFCRDLRAERKFADMPVIFLTGKTEVASKVQGFEVGGDDYVTKPFDPEELKARVRGKLRRSKSAGSSFVISGFRVDLSLHKIFAISEEGGETPLPLTPIEFKLLSHFMKNEGKVFSRQKLLEMFWGDSLYVSKHTVDTHISSLRKKLGAPGSQLRSIFKQGYTFTTPNEIKDTERDITQ
ncbi:response regulator transcription factor [Bdellovibrio sp. HCB209]|uniref:response regulator transcription factor n=1 Tax=Bdellovibrio sp. HCB209 TaxID=3394354 RepID=UPI0039B52F2F